MPFGAIAGAVGGLASIFGGNASADAADAASKRQAATAQQGIDFQREVLQQIQKYLTPYINAGGQGLNQLQDLTIGGPGTGVFSDPRLGPGLAGQPPPNQAFNFQGPTSGMFGQNPLQAIFGGGIGADPNTQMTSGRFGKMPNDLTIADYHASPGYASATQGGLEAIRNSASRTGGAVSGNALKALTGFGTQAANQDYQDWRNNYGTNFQNANTQYANNFNNLGSLYSNQFNNMASIYGNEADRYSTDYYKNVGINSGLSNDLFSKLQLIAAMGQSAATGGAGPAINASSNIASSLAGLGTAQASGILGSNNALQGGISSGITSLLSGNALGGGGSGGGGIGALLSNLFSNPASSNSAMQSYGVFPGANNPYTSYGGGDGASGFY